MDCGFACFGGCLRDFMTRGPSVCVPSLACFVGGFIWLSVCLARGVLAVSWCASAASLEEGGGAGAAQDAVLACYYAGQVKVAEMPLDTCRMMQALEWEDPAASAPCDTAVSGPRRAHECTLQCPSEPTSHGHGIALLSPASAWQVLR